MSDVTEVATEDAANAVNEAFGLGGSEEPVAEPRSSGLTAPVEPPKEEVAEEAQEAAQETEEAIETPSEESILERVERQLQEAAGASEEAPAHPSSEQELRERLAHLEGQVKGRGDTGEKEAPKGATTADELRSPAVAKLFRDALEGDDPTKFTDLLVETTSRLTSAEIKSLKADYDTKFAEAEQKAQAAAWANTARATANNAVIAISQFADAYPAVAELVEDYKVNPEASRLFKLWARNPETMTDPQTLFTSGMGLAATYQAQGGLPQNGGEETPSAPPATQTRSTGARPKAGNREAQLNQPKETVEDRSAAALAAINANLESNVGGRKLDFD